MSIMICHFLQRTRMIVYATFISFYEIRSNENLPGWQQRSKDTKNVQGDQNPPWHLTSLPIY